MVRGVLAVFALALLGGCGFGSNYTGSYVASEEGVLMQLSLVETENRQISATFSMSSPDFEEGKLATVTGWMTGVRDGSTIGLLASNGSGGSMSLTKDNDGLVWQVPGTGQSFTFVEMGRAEYQRKLVELNNLLHVNDVGMLPAEH